MQRNNTQTANLFLPSTHGFIRTKTPGQGLDHQHGALDPQGRIKLVSERQGPCESMQQKVAPRCVSPRGLASTTSTMTTKTTQTIGTTHITSGTRNGSHPHAIQSCVPAMSDGWPADIPIAAVTHHHLNAAMLHRPDILSIVPQLQGAPMRPCRSAVLQLHTVNDAVPRHPSPTQHRYRKNRFPSRCCPRRLSKRCERRCTPPSFNLCSL